MAGTGSLVWAVTAAQVAGQTSPASLSHPLGRALALREPAGGGQPDRGVRFTAKRYRARVRQAGGCSSMGAKGDCYDNALAERMNGILKLEYGLDSRFRDLAQARRTVRESIWLYNHDRPYLVLDYRTPAQVHAVG